MQFVDWDKRCRWHYLMSPSSYAWIIALDIRPCDDLGLLISQTISTYAQAQCRRYEVTVPIQFSDLADVSLREEAWLQSGSCWEVAQRKLIAAKASGASGSVPCGLNLTFKLPLRSYRYSAMPFSYSVADESTNLPSLTIWFASRESGLFALGMFSDILSNSKTTVSAFPSSVQASLLADSCETRPGSVI